MYTQFTTILIFFMVGILMVPLILLIGKILRPHHPDAGKLSTYECGEIPVGSSWVQFNLRFYVIAILFLIFEVEIVLMLPIGTMFKQWMTETNGFLVFMEIAIFIAILLVGFAYAWHEGDLEWIRPSHKTPSDKKNQTTHVTP